MALARPQTAGSLDTIKIALIVFVCLTLASLTGTVILYTNHASLTEEADAAKRSATSANQTLAKMRQDVSELSRKMTGTDADDPEKVRQGVESALRPILADEQVKAAGVTAEASLTAVMQGLYRLYSSNAQLLAKTQAERDDLNRQIAGVNEQSAARAKEFAEKSDRLQKDFQKTEQTGSANQQAWSTQIEDLKKRLEASSSGAAQQLSGERQARAKLEQQIEQSIQRVREMTEKLAKFQPNAQGSIEQNADGRVVRYVAREGLVYIDLGRRDRVSAGMPFSVYSAHKGAGANQKEKATIEIANVFDTTAECKVTSSTPTDPILEGDLIANVIYERGRQYNFVVAGDFDLNFDGKIDDPGGQKVAQLIQRWGGKVLPQLDTQVDYVVLGAPPPLPPKPAENADEATKMRYAQAEQVRKAFDAVRAEARSLSVPVLTRGQFFHLVGMPAPTKAPPVTPAPPAERAAL